MASDESHPGTGFAVLRKQTCCGKKTYVGTAGPPGMIVALSSGESVLIAEICGPIAGTVGGRSRRAGPADGSRLDVKVIMFRSRSVLTSGWTSGSGEGFVPPLDTCSVRSVGAMLT